MPPRGHLSKGSFVTAGGDRALFGMEARQAIERERIEKARAEGRRFFMIVDGPVDRGVVKIAPELVPHASPISEIVRRLQQLREALQTPIRKR